jgi:hypothetical protein
MYVHPAGYDGNRHMFYLQLYHIFYTKLKIVGKIEYPNCYPLIRLCLNSHYYPKRSGF